MIFRYEGLVLSVGGNGRSYVLILEAGPLADMSQSKLYFARFNTKVGFCRVWTCFLLMAVVSLIALVSIFSTFFIFHFPFSSFNNWQVRVPFSSFRPVKPDDPPLDPFLIHTLTIRFEPRRQVGILLLDIETAS